MIAEQTTVSPTLGSEAPITVAFAVGWQMADLFALAEAPPPKSPPQAASPSQTKDGLPSMGDLKSTDRWDLLVRQVRAKVAQLTAAFLKEGAAVDGLEKFNHLAADMIGGVKDAPATAVEQAHIVLLETLTVAHSRLGRAYGVGQGLADTRRLKPEATEAEFQQLFGPRLSTIENSLTDLASSLPDHSSRAVMLSLAQWKEWAAAPTLSNEKVSWPNAAIVVALQRQGDLWRALLSGEKLGKDMLEAANYLEASKTLFRRVVKSRPWLWGILIGAAILVGLGVYLVITAASVVKAISGIVLSVLGAVGITAASVKRTFAQLETQLGAEVWGAELDWAIGDAITVAPGEWNINPKKIDVPARGPDPDVASHVAAVGKLRGALQAGKNKKVWEVLHTKCAFKSIDDQEPKASTGDDVTTWLLTQAPLLAKHTKTIPGEHGRLVSTGDTNPPSYFVWQFRHRKIATVLVFKAQKDAWDAAGIAPLS